jgi:hypothetical protein
MSCECYRIGGRFIAEDPDCPAHGRNAQAEQQRSENLKESIYLNLRRAETVEDLRAVLYDILEMI